MQAKPRQLVADQFGALLRELRNERGLSQETLAFEAEVDRTFISMLERGVRVPTVVTLLQLANALQVTPEAIMERLCRSLERIPKERSVRKGV